MDALESMAERLISDADFSLLNKEFSQFCPFEAVGMVHAEIRHGNFLSYLLNPFAPHGFRTSILRAFVMAVTQQGASINVGELALDDAEVRREWHNIDLLVILPTTRLVIPVELKVNSVQGPGQLSRYRAVVEKNWPVEEGWRHACVFLTKRDEKPEDEGWLALGFRELCGELEKVVETTDETAVGRPMVRSYVRMLRRHHLGDKRLEELAHRLWAQHGEALSFLAERRPDMSRKLFDLLLNRAADLAGVLNLPERPVVLDKQTNTIIRFAFAGWDEFPGFLTSTWTDSKRLVLLELKLDGAVIGAHLYIGPGETSARDAYAKLLFEKRFPDSGSRKIYAKHTCFARSDLFDPRDNEGIEIEAAIDLVITGLKSFADRVFGRFNPVLQTIGAN